MNLEQQLKQAAEPWLAEENLSQEQGDTLAALVGARSREQADEALTAPVPPVASRTGPRFRWGTFAAAAAAVVLLVGGPVVTGMASNLPVIGPFVSRFAYFDRGAQWANDQGYIAPVGLASTDKGYTFRVEGVMADAARTTIYWVIEGPNLVPGTPVELTVPDAHKRGWHTVHKSEVTDGRLVGSTTVGPLHDSKENISLHVTEVADVKGDWTVAFEASRAALDPLTRTVVMDQKVAGDGYALTVRQVLFAPTETVVSVEQSAAGDLVVLSSQLLADGVVVPKHADVSYWQNERTGPFTGKTSLIFDRVEGEPTQLTLKIDELGRAEKGGPVLDLTRPGATADAESATLTVRSIDAARGKTTVTLDVKGSTTHLTERFEWMLTGANGLVLPNTSTSMDRDGRELVLIFDGELKSPVKLASRQTVKTVARDLIVNLPTK